MIREKNSESRFCVDFRSTCARISNSLQQLRLIVVVGNKRTAATLQTISRLSFHSEVLRPFFCGPTFLISGSLIISLFIEISRLL